MGAFFPKIRALFSNLRKSAGETSPLPPSSYVPDREVQTKASWKNGTQTKTSCYHK